MGSNVNTILHTNDNYINVKVDEWVSKECIDNGYKIKRHRGLNGCVSFTINNKSFTNNFFERKNCLKRIIRLNTNPIVKYSSYGKYVDNCGIPHKTIYDSGKVNLYDLTISNFTNAIRKVDTIKDDKLKPVVNYDNLTIEELEYFITYLDVLMTSKMVKTSDKFYSIISKLEK